jgi:hypothetical protein
MVNKRKLIEMERFAKVDGGLIDLKSVVAIVTCDGTTYFHTGGSGWAPTRKLSEDELDFITDFWMRVRLQ